MPDDIVNGTLTINVVGSLFDDDVSRMFDLPFAAPGGVRENPVQPIGGEQPVDPGVVDMGLPPLVVDVISSTPEPVMRALPGLRATPIDYQSSSPGTAVPGLGGPPMNGDSFQGIDFPTLRDVVGGIENIASGIISTRRKAPDAPLLGGACPPGRVLRRIHLGRDKCVKKPRMNMCNQHALRRATARLRGFFNLVKHAEKAVRHSLGPALPKHHARQRISTRFPCAGCGARSSRSCNC